MKTVIILALGSPFILIGTIWEFACFTVGFGREIAGEYLLKWAREK